jgi:hypothetical protein
MTTQMNITYINALLAARVGRTRLRYATNLKPINWQDWCNKHVRPLAST